jgi:tRNA(Ile)-lysidine synthase TilS/MesJ
VVADPKTEIQHLLQYCELPWQDQCLNFQDNAAPVATASSVQVRQKIYNTAIQRWRHYEPWLGDVKTLLERQGINYL